MPGDQYTTRGMRGGAIQQALVAPAPLGPNADRHQGRHVERMAQGPGPALGQTPLAGEASTVVGARLQPGVGHHLVDARKARAK